MKTLLIAGMACLLIACETTPKPSGGAGANSKTIERFDLDKTPEKKFTVIGSISDDASEAEEDEVMDQFSKKAAKMGGDAIMVKSKKDSGMELVPFTGKMNKTFLYKIDVIRFDP